MRLRFFHQRDMMDCGAVCLQCICNYYGKDFDLQYIRELCHITRNGVSMLGIADAAEQLGFKTIGIKLNWEQISNDVHLPCIIHWSQQHFVVVGSIKNNRVTVMDPAAGILKYHKADFLNSWLNLRDTYSDKKLGAALLLSPTASFYNKTCLAHRVETLENKSAQKRMILPANESFRMPVPNFRLSHTLYSYITTYCKFAI